jgi:ZIP family zinc transporter
VAALGESALVGLAVGGSLILGAGGAAALRLAERAAAAITAFGGGILLAAVALELVPEADDRAGGWLTAVGLAVGTVVYVGADASSPPPSWEARCSSTPIPPSSAQRRRSPPAR